MVTAIHPPLPPSRGTHENTERGANFSQRWTQRSPLAYNIPVALQVYSSWHTERVPLKGRPSPPLTGHLIGPSLNVLQSIAVPTSTPCPLPCSLFPHGSQLHLMLHPYLFVSLSHMFQLDYKPHLSKDFISVVHCSFHSIRSVPGTRKALGRQWLNTEAGRWGPLAVEYFQSFPTDNVHLDPQKIVVTQSSFCMKELLQFPPLYEYLVLC